MSFKIKSLRIRNFKCFDNKKYYKFDIDYTANPVILSGPNGFGKTTFFDAVELIFGNKITRFNQGIENAKTDIVSNILLNSPNQNESKINKVISDNNNILNLCKYTEIFQGDFDVKNYSKAAFEKLRNLLPNDIDFDIVQIEGLINNINDLNKNLSDNQKKSKSLLDAREHLKNINSQINKDAKNCPYCNHMYNDNLDLETNFDNLSRYIIGENNKFISELKEQLEKIELNLIQCKEYILGKTLNFSEEKVQRLQSVTNEYIQILNDDQLTKRINDFRMFLLENNNHKELNSIKNIDDILQCIEKSYKLYTNLEYTTIHEKYKLKDVDDYMKENHLVIIDDLNESILNEKIKYVESEFDKYKNTKYLELRKNLKLTLKEKMLLASSYNKIKRISNIYAQNKQQYKDEIIRKLIVPLLIYTSKILQDYQSGLGVFIQGSDMRFVSDANSKHDILNTFSSGQLSGFIISFLFAMNKIYIQKSSDDIGFILIDDPVQTMDDINIASLVEVLRNDFSDKQLIISTHETDKENYMLYKFLKYKSKGQSFNIKDELYS